MASSPAGGRSPFGRRRRYSSSGPSNRSRGLITLLWSRRAKSSSVSTRRSPKRTECADDEDVYRSTRSHAPRAQPSDARETAPPQAGRHRRGARDRATRGLAGTVVALSIHRTLVTPRRLPTREALVGDRAARRGPRETHAGHAS